MPKKSNLSISLDVAGSYLYFSPGYRLQTTGGGKDKTEDKSRRYFSVETLPVEINNYNQHNSALSTESLVLTMSLLFHFLGSCTYQQYNHLPSQHNHF